MKRRLIFFVCALVVLLMGTAVMADPLRMKTKGNNTYVYPSGIKKYGYAVSVSETIRNAAEKGQLRKLHCRMLYLIE